MLIVLALLAVVGLYTAATLQDALFGAVLSGTRVFQQRAFALADFGVEQALQELAATTAPGDYTHELRPLPGDQNSVTVGLRASGSEALPPGFSAGRLVAQRFEIISTGHAARGARSVQVQGVVRVVPVTGIAP